MGDGNRGVMPPCGRCRQVLLDYFPSIGVIVAAGDVLSTVPIAELLPAAYVWTDQR
ncbi:hypothetical protein [Actinomadura madurae]|uniref:hypothetical protein n=1 Tax=Actinomadura madurae TaxID=1993 RepID=UPI0020D21D57|nr:hypothetical protein [Actinomadura madurae]MCP9969041.1 hypothetical protein [Actinomadura madurae]MCQ0017711.1 hypothetical protein [Actinomadura madurae]